MTILITNEQSRYPFSLLQNSDNAILIEFLVPISENLTRHIVTVSQVIESESIKGFVELVPAYNSILIIYNPLVIKQKKLASVLDRLLCNENFSQPQSGKLIEIPVCYDTEFAPDLKYLANYCGLCTQEVIQKHSQQEYLVQMLGFLPGFLYLSGLDEKLFCPRKNTPELNVSHGSIAIGGEQTGVYPVDSPGGWHVIGKTPIRTFLPEQYPPAIAEPLDRVRFKPISLAQFKAMESSA